MSKVTPGDLGIAAAVLDDAVRTGADDDTAESAITAALFNLDISADVARSTAREMIRKSKRK